MMQGIMKWLEVLLLAMCRTAYCWIFFFISCIGIYEACMSILSAVRSHARWNISYGYTIVAIYSIIWGVAWWMIFRDKLASKRWTIAANLTLIFTYLPALATGSWRDVLKAELAWWPFILFGIIGIIVFSIPYHGWRQKSQVQVSRILAPIPEK